jgi:hypothetical protein
VSDEPVEGARFSVRNAAGEKIAGFEDILDALEFYKRVGNGARIYRSDGALMATMRCALSGGLPYSGFGPSGAVVSVSWGNGSGIGRRVA